MSNAAANQQRYLLFCCNTARRVNGRDRGVSCQDDRIDVRLLATATEIVLRQPFTNSIDGRQRGIRQMGKWG